MALSMLLPRRQTLFALYLTPVSTLPNEALGSCCAAPFFGHADYVARLRNG
jgi:hypothetical protein